MSRKRYTRTGIRDASLPVHLSASASFEDIEFYFDIATVNNGTSAYIDFDDANWGYNRDFHIYGYTCIARFSAEPFQFYYQAFIIGPSIYAPGYAEAIGCLDLYYVKDAVYNGSDWYVYISRLFNPSLQVDQANKIRFEIRNDSGVNTDVGECRLYMMGVPI